MKLIIQRLSFFIIFCVLATVVTPTMAVVSNGMVITVNGHPNASIIIPVDATLREKFAAEELQKYIKAISGAVLHITPDSKKVSGNLIMIGGADRNKETEKLISKIAFKKTVPGPEGMLIKTFGNRALVLAGSNGNQREYERGTLYAVYEFLETYLGCSFVAYGKPGAGMGEYIPTVKSIKIGSVNYVKTQADLSYRTGIVQYNPNKSHQHGLGLSLIDWLAKNRYNRINTMASVYEDFKTNGLLFEAQKRGLLFSVGHHESSLLFLPPNGNNYFPEKYYQTHPEYYRLMADGKRFLPTEIWHGQWIFDSRNPDAAKQIADNIKIWLSKNPYVDIVSLWPLDGTDPQCTGIECSKYTKAENYAYFVNEVAKIVKQQYPDVKIDMLVYHDIWKYPKGLTLDPSLLVEHANSTRTFGKSDGTSILGTDYELNAKQWAAGGATLVYYDYYMGKFAGNQVYFPMADELQKVYSSFKTDKFTQGSGTQIEAYNLWNFIFNFYTNGRTMYNTALSLDMSLNKFGKIFGAGAPYIAQYINYAEQFYEDNGGTSPGKWFAKNVNKNIVYDFFEKAYNAQPEGKLRDNIRMLRMAFRFSDLYTNGGGEAEMKYMYDNFDSYDHLTGYGVSVRSEGKGNYTPDKWYQMH